MIIFRHLFEMLLNPFFLVLVLYSIFLVLFYLNKDRRFIRGGFLLVFLLLLLFSTGWLAQGITRKLEDQYPAITEVDPTIHWVVIFSGGQAGLTGIPTNSILTRVSIKRLVEGLRLYRQLPNSKLLLSGGGYASEVPEAIRLSELASWFAIPKSKIVLETESINTADQVKEIKQIVHDEPFYLITSAIHMPRAMKLCQGQGLHPIAAPTDFTFYWNDERWAKMYLPNPHNLFYLSVAMHEVLGRVWAKIKGD